MNFATLGSDNGTNDFFTATATDSLGTLIRLSICARSIGMAASLAEACGYTLISIG